MIDRQCPRCGTSFAETANFCTVCGSRVSGVQEARSRFMTVMFIDLVDSTSITEEIGNEAMFDLIERFQRLCQASITSAGGYVAKFLGDGAMAYFGYPVAMKDSAEAAVTCAVGIMQRAARELSANGQPVRTSCGIATGWCVVNDMHLGDAAQEALAIGDTVNRSARLQAIAGANEIFISSDVQRSLRASSLPLRDVGALRLKGIRDRLDVWAIDAVNARHGSQVPATAEAGFSEGPARAFVHAATQDEPYVVGRVDLLNRMTRAFEDASAGRAVVVDIVAPGGYGKTSLVAEFLAQQSRTNVMKLACRSHQSEQSFACFRDLIRHLAGIGPDMTDAERTLAAWAPEGALEGLNLLLNISQIPVAAVVRLGRVTSALEAVVDRATETAPLILSVDDAHFIDADSMGFLKLVTEKFARRPILILLTRRPEQRNPNLAVDHHIELTPLQEEDAGQLIALLDPTEGLNAASRRAIIERAGGVPLYIRHFTLTVLEKPQLRIDNTIPETLIEALVQRFDMHGVERRFIEAAAVLRDPVPVEVIAQMLDIRREEILPIVETLVGRGLLRWRSESIVEFDHGLIREAVLETLLSVQLGRLHRSALDAYRAVAPELVERHPEIEAHHLIGSGQFASAVPKLTEAAQTATLRGEIAECVRLVRMAEDLLSRIDDATVRDQLEMTTQFALGNALVQHRGFSDARVAAAFQRALDLCLSLAGGNEIEFQIAWGIWAHMVVVADVRGAVQMSDRMAGIAAANPHLEVLSSAAESVMKFNLGQFEAQDAAFRRTQDLYDQSLHGLHALTYSMDSLELSLLFQIHGRFIACDTQGWRSAYKAARDHEAALGIPLLSPYIRIFSLASNCYAPSTFPVREELLEARALADRLGQPFWVVTADLWLGAERYHREGPTAAIEQLEQAVAAAESMGIQIFVRYHEALLAHGYAAAGRHAAAEDLWSRIGTGENMERNLMLWPEILRIRAEARQLAAAPEETVRADLTEAEELADRLGAFAWLVKIRGTRDRLGLPGDVAETSERDGQLAGILSREGQDHPAIVSTLAVSTLAS